MNRGTSVKTGAKATSGNAKKDEGHERITSKKVRSGTTKPRAASFFSYKSVDDKDVLALIEVVRNGISYKDFSEVVDDAPFSLTEWAHYLQLSERTIQRNQKERRPFQPIQSERIVELSMLYKYGVEVFGDKDNFDTWLNSKSIALGGR